MALPNQFSNKTQATGAQLDENFAALGNLTPIPCTASGSNTIVLTANADTPTITAYSNYMQFTAVAAQTNTGAATGKVGSFATLSIYKPGPSAPVVLSGGEIVAGVAFTLLYDSALNSGSGGFHLMGMSAVTFAGGSISGPIVGTGSLATITYPVGVFPLLQGVTLAQISLASVTRMAVGPGPTITRILSTVAAVTWSAINPQLSAESIVALSGCSVGDNIQIGYPSSIASQIAFRAYVPNAGSVSLIAQNYSASTITPPSGNYRVTATGFTG